MSNGLSKDLLLLVLFVVAFVVVEETPQQLIVNINAWMLYIGGTFGIGG